MIIKRKKGFLTLEYVILFVVIVAALLTMSVYLKRALSGKWRSAGDVFGFGRQYQR